MNNGKDKSQEVKSFKDLRRRKKEVQGEIDAAARGVSKSTEELMEEGVKVAAVGFVAFLLSRLLNVFLGTNRKPSGDTVAMAYSTQDSKSADSDKSNSEQESSSEHAGVGGHAHSQMNGHQTILDSARFWIETISGGLEAAKIIIDQISEVQDQMNEKPREEHTKEKTNAS